MERVAIINYCENLSQFLRTQECQDIRKNVYIEQTATGK